MLYTQFLEEEIYPNQSDLNDPVRKRKYNSVYYLKNLSNEITENVNLLMGHYTLDAGDIFFGNLPYKKLIFLRDPIERAVSNIFHLKYIMKSDKYSNLSPEEIFNIKSEEFTHRYVKVLSGNHSIDSVDEITQKDLESAIKNLNSFDFIGITEDYSKSIELAEQMFNWKLGVIPKQNVNTKSKIEKLNLNGNFIENLISNNLFDIKLYNAAKNMHKLKSSTFL